MAENKTPDWLIELPQTHPLRSYYDQRLRHSLNTDNKTISDTTVTNEYEQVMQHLNLGKVEALSMAEASIKSAFLTSSDKRDLLNRFDEYMLRVGEQLHLR